MVVLDNSCNKPLVSIIVNCFNGEKFLEDCLNSILNQTYYNFELIIVDDGSIDKTAKIGKLFFGIIIQQIIVKKFLKNLMIKDLNIIYLRNTLFYMKREI